MQNTVTVRMFGLLRSARKKANLPCVVEVEVPPEGISAHDIAVDLGLELEVIEGVFINRTVYGLMQPIKPGDRVAFVPYGTPGPHRFTLGLYDAGRETRACEDEEPR